MAGSNADEAWDEAYGTAVAGPSYQDSIAKSEADEFESEVGTAVAGQDYVENIRKSGDIAVRQRMYRSQAMDARSGWL